MRQAAISCRLFRPSSESEIGAWRKRAGVAASSAVDKARGLSKPKSIFLMKEGCAALGGGS